MGVLRVGDLEIEVIKKDIKNIHLGVYPPIGRVRLSAPTSSNDEKIRLFIVSKIPWIRKNQRKFKDKERLTSPNFISRESHYIAGRRYLLEVDINAMSNNRVILGKNKIRLNLKEDYSTEKRQEIIENWLRKNLKIRIEPILKKWEDLMNLHCSEWKIKKMKTKWGSCNEEAKRLWFNLELMKVNDSCLEYVIVHELIHLTYKHHNKFFYNTLTKFIPDWKYRKSELNKTLLVY